MPKTFTTTVHVLNTANDDELEITRQIAVATWRQLATEAGLTPDGEPNTDLDPHASPGSDHERGWTVTGPVKTT